MRYLFQTVQPQRKEARLATLWALILLRLRPHDVQALMYQVPLRQSPAPHSTRELTCQLPSADGSAHGRDLGEQARRRRAKGHGLVDDQIL